MNDDQIKHMVDRFLSWRLPENFAPDAGISFKQTFNDHLPQPTKHNPTGTNLFDATQADAMVRYMVEGVPREDRREVAWLIEAPGQNYLGVSTLGGEHRFHWTKDHAKALRFWTRMQADDVMMAVRALNPGLFAFAVNLGEASSTPG